MSDRNPKNWKKKIRNFARIEQEHLIPKFGDQGSIWNLVAAVRIQLAGTVLDDVFSDPAELTHLFIKFLDKKNMHDLARSIKLFRKLRNLLVHKKIITLGFLEQALTRVVSFCAWMKQYAEKNTAPNAFNQNAITDLLKRVYSLARTVGIELPSNTHGSNATSTSGLNVLPSSNTNQSKVPAQSFLNAGDPQLASSAESDEEDSERSFDMPVRRNNNVVGDEASSEDDEDRSPPAHRPNNNNNNNDVVDREDCSDDDEEMHSCEEVGEVSLPVPRPLAASRFVTFPRHLTGISQPTAVPLPIAKPTASATPTPTKSAAPMATSSPFMSYQSAQAPPTVLPQRGTSGRLLLRIGDANPTPAPQPPQVVAPPPPPPPHQLQPAQASHAFHGVINQYPGNYRNDLKNRVVMVRSGRFAGLSFLLIRPNGSNYEAHCTVTGRVHWLPVATTVIDVQAPVVVHPAIVLRRAPPNNSNVVQVPAADVPAQVPIQQNQPPQQVPPVVQHQPQVMTAADAKQNLSELIKGKTLTLRSGRYSNSTGVFCNWNGNNWRWRCVGNGMCDRCVKEPNFKHASPNDTQIEVQW